MNWFAQMLARLLPHVDREPVLGDLCESGASGTVAVIDLCGLIVRRALLPYRSWKTWLFLGAAVQVSFLLIGTGVSTVMQVLAWRHGAIASTASCIEMVRLVLMLCFVPMAEGFAAFTLSRKMPASRAMFVPLLLVPLATSTFCFHGFHRTDALAWSVFLFLPSVALGAWLAHRGIRITRTDSAGWIVLLIAILWPSTGAEAWQWFNGVLLLLPALLCSIILSGRERHAIVYQDKV